MAIQSAAIIQGGPTSSRQQVFTFIQNERLLCVSAVMLYGTAVGGEIWGIVSHGPNLGITSWLQMRMVQSKSWSDEWWRAVGSLGDEMRFVIPPEDFYISVWKEQRKWYYDYILCEYMVCCDVCFCGTASLSVSVQRQLYGKKLLSTGWIVGIVVVLKQRHKSIFGQTSNTQLRQRSGNTGRRR